MTNPIADPGHGHSPAAWIAVTIMLLAFTAGTVFYIMDLPWLVIASGVLVIVGWITGGVMAKLGYGVKGPKYSPKAH